MSPLILLPSVASFEVPTFRTLEDSSIVSGDGISGDATNGVNIVGSYTTTSSQILTVNYDADLTTLQWQRQFGDNNTELGYGIANNVSGDVYSFGTTDDAPLGSPRDALLTKHNSSGTLQWQRRIGGQGTGFTVRGPIGLDVGGNVYMALAANVVPNLDDLFLLKFNSLGTLQWQRHLFSNTVDSFPGGCMVDPGSGNVYIVFNTFASPGQGGNEIFLAKYNVFGVIQWQRVIGTSGGELPGARDSIDYDRSGSGAVYLVSRAGVDMVVLKISSTGTILWQRRLLATPGGDGVASDSSGNVYVGAGNIVVKYDSSGNILWQGSIQAENSTYVRALHVIGDYVYGVGQAQRSGVGSDVDMLVFRLHKNGTAPGVYGAITFAATSLTDQAGDFIIGTPSLTDQAGGQTVQTPALADLAATLTDVEQI